MARDNHDDNHDHNDDDHDDVDASETCAWTRSNVVCKGPKMKYEIGENDEGRRLLELLN